MPRPDWTLTFPLFSGLVLDESSTGPVSHLNPKDIALWTHSIPAPDLTEETVQSLDWTDSFMMRRPGDDAFSASSSMDDSAYVSLPDAQRQQGRSTTDAQYRFLQDDSLVESDSQMMQQMFSPSVSSVPYQGQTESSSFMLPPSSDASITGDMGGLAISQAQLWQMQAPAGASPVSMAYPPEVHSPAVIRHPSQQTSFSQAIQGAMPQDGTRMNFSSQVAYMPSQSPDFVSGAMGVPSRTSSRATMSGYASGSSTQRTPFTSGGNASSVPMLRQPSSGLSSVQYYDAGSEMSPTSPVLSLEQTSPVIGFQPSEDYSAYINLDPSEPNDEMRSDIVEEIKDESEASDMAIATRGPIEENARSDPLYSANPLKDGLYHCPYMLEGRCDQQHRATKLKCNYDKYIDSHLRPFRCKEAECVDVPFSSTACLLRHQREAHGMHGHGQKPHLCHYLDCERSKEGGGFPRKYNLYDHMKRVHNHSVSMQDEDGRAPKRGGAAATGRKRSSIAGPVEPVRQGRVEKKPRVTKAEVEAQQAQLRRAKIMQQLKVQWTQRKHSMMEKVQNVQGPEDPISLVTLEQVKEDVAAMERIAARLGEMG